MTGSQASTNFKFKAELFLLLLCFVPIEDPKSEKVFRFDVL